MLRSLIALSVQHRALVLLLAAAMTLSGLFAVGDLALDALPDSSDTQVIVVTDFPGRAGEVVDDQITLPLAADLLRSPGATDVRGLSLFGQSFVYVLFEDGTDLYWARSRVLEQLSVASRHLPEGVVPYLGPDATGVGWVYQYTLYPGYFCPKHRQGLWHDETTGHWYANRTQAAPQIQSRLIRVRGQREPGKCPIDGTTLIPAALDLAQLRSLQEWTLRLPLSSVAGVAEVATIGGFTREYQVVVDPLQLEAHAIPLTAVAAAIRASNQDVGASVIERSEREYMVRGRGALRDPLDLQRVVVGYDARRRPILLGDVATVQVGGESRRGVGELDGIGEAVGAVVIARHGENANRVIAAVKDKLSDLQEGLPPGVLIIPTYDRSALIGRAVATLSRAVAEELVVVALVCLLFLAHARSALIAVVTLPVGLLMSIATMHALGINANVMSLGGLALAIGVMVDSAIVMIENAHRRLDSASQEDGGEASASWRLTQIVEAAQEVGPSLFVALLILAVSFLPIFALGGQSGRLFRPLAYTKSFAMFAAALLGLTLVPALMAIFIKGRIPRETDNPINRVMMKAYAVAFRAVLRHPWATLLGALLLGLSTLVPLRQLGNEFMPPFEEGDLLYMPTTQPGISLTKSRELLQQTDKLIRAFPEVASVHGKIGRADTATDPAPLSMIETLVRLHASERWRQRKLERFYSSWPDWARTIAGLLWPATRTITLDELKFGWTDADGTAHPGLNDALALPGVSNAWPAPIEGRLNMLSTGMKTPVGVKILGPDVSVLDPLAEQTALALRRLPRTISAHAERTLGGLHLDVEIDRARTAIHGINSGDVQETLAIAVGGKTVTTVLEGGERYPLNIRYPAELRDDPEDLGAVTVSTPSGRPIPLSEVATIAIHAAPDMIRSEDGQRSVWVFVDTDEHDLGGYVEAARRLVEEEAPLPPGYSRVWSGRYEQLRDTNARLRLVVPLTLALIVLLLYVANRSWFRVGLILLAVPFSLIGAVWFLWLLGYNFSLAVWVGMIALLGLDAETGQIMLLYLDSSFTRFREQGRMRHRIDLYDAVYEGAVRRIRPKTMSVGTAILGLLPLLWASGTGADLTRRIVAPMIGGLSVSFAMELLLYPVIFYLVKGRSLPAT